ncbi:hypothetical protein RSOLAG1IB_05409 [Rhizoctonia solani AG-1 IB]|uniref:Uncharacterized protein n=1 Tax=Thanatephorus cucumeris (strain AG1-IB / isolate 7/3/14) TaxID=1108050 RepID=A0A0B7G2M4_THACB|nr:hypothetical protein RSOLAG1IB_05409 [Rhizoctonia solani AG-1 IB]
MDFGGSNCILALSDCLATSLISVIFPKLSLPIPYMALVKIVLKIVLHTWVKFQFDCVYEQRHTCSYSSVRTLKQEGKTQLGHITKNFG